MHHRRAALALVLALCALASNHAAGQQSQQPRGRKVGALGQNDPNPFNAGTTIPFRVGSGDCADGSARHVVSLRIYNVLTQLVAVPTLLPSASPPAGAAPAASVGRPVADMALPCGNYAARWTGRYLSADRPAAPGVYVVQLVVDGRVQAVRKVMVGK